ncbi:hypothetical protein SDC9_147317 [bioreactor metagenome]|uniref:Uncharacterized protein n=1 Tax=bioreactor metagenome TaxID=1076179 RepID=A0A645EHQ0_9ZZZZ
MINIRKSYLVLLCITFLLAIFPSSITQGAPKTDYDWVLILTRDETKYTVDMNSIKIIDHTILFWGVSDNANETYVSFSYFSVNPNDRIFRFEKSARYDKQTLSEISYTRTPSEWEPILTGSPIEIAITYILEHHPDAKKVLNKTKE